MTARNTLTIAAVSVFLCFYAVLALNIHRGDVHRPFARKHDVHTNPASPRELMLARQLKINTALFTAADDTITDAPNDDDKRKKIKRKKAKARSDMARYDERTIKPWTMSDSFNSTTMKYLFDIKVSQLHFAINHTNITIFIVNLFDFTSYCFEMSNYLSRLSFPERPRALIPKTPYPKTLLRHFFTHRTACQVAGPKWRALLPAGFWSLLQRCGFSYSEIIILFLSRYIFLIISILY